VPSASAAKIHSDLKQDAIDANSFRIEDRVANGIVSSDLEVKSDIVPRLRMEIKTMHGLV
jgi:hypothetical protein